MSEPTAKSQRTFQLNEDWLSVLIAFVLLLLAAIGVIGKTGIIIPF